MALESLEKIWTLADGTTYHQPKASGAPSSTVYVCRVCGEVYGRVKAFLGDQVYYYQVNGRGCCLNCPAYHPMITPGYLAILNWDEDWPIELWHYHLNLLLDEFDRGQGYLHYYTKQGIIV